jgi:hypothetical protein
MQPVENDVKNDIQSGVHNQAPSFFLWIAKLPLQAIHTELLCKQQLIISENQQEKTKRNT